MTGSSDYFTIYTGREKRGVTASAFNLLSNARSGSHIPFTLPELEGPFLKLKLTSQAGSFTLEGGGDAGAVRTTLDLVQPADATFCSNPVQPDETDFLEKDNAAVTYVGNAGGGDDCFGVQLTAGPTEVRFLKPLDVAPDAQFKFVVTWTLPNSGGTPSVLIPEADIDFEFGTTNVTNMPFCSTFDQTILGYEAGNRAVVDFTAFNADPAFEDFEPDQDGKQFACIDTRSSTVTAEQIDILDTIFAIGDLKMTIR